MSDEENLNEIFNTYLDTIQQVFGEVLTEWDENDYIKPIPDAKVEFSCNDCGKCCNFQTHDVWVYPFDMIKWLNNWDNEKRVPMFLSALLPVQDLDDVKGVGLPSQKQLHSAYQYLINSASGKEKTLIKKTLTTILQILKQINPTFNQNSDYCIYYDKTSKQGGHCLIYEHRPLQCRTYPYDYPCFTKVEIPNVEEKEDPNILPMCPSETFTNGNPEDGVLISDDHLEEVILEKSNYRTSTIIKQWADESEDWKQFLDLDLNDLLLELFHEEINYITRKQKNIQVEPKNPKSKSPNKKKSKKSTEIRENRTKRYIAGKRPQRK